MSEIRLNTSKELMTFLKILAEESIVDAREQIESDPMQREIVSSMKSDEKVFGPLDEEDPPEEVSDEEEVESTASVEVEEDPVSLEVSLDSIISAVKDLRSGRSVDDSRIKQQLRLYFDRLDSFERESMLAFFRGFAGILTGEFDATGAPDPSDEPYSITMSKGDEQMSSQQQEPQAMPQQQADSSTEEFEEEEDDDVEDLEDTSPPIQTGGEQQLAEIRRRVRKLMSR